MTAQLSWKRRTASLLATGTAAIIALTGALVAPTAAFAEEMPATGVSVTKINGADPHAKWPNVAVNAGSTLTLTGSLPATLDVAGNPTATGAYLQWCVKPAEGQRPTECDKAAQQWLSSVALGAPYNMPATGTVADGVWSFTTDITPPKSVNTTECGAAGAAECGIYVRPDHRFGGAVTAQDQFVPIRFATELGLAESLTAKAVPASDPVNKVKVEVEATGFALEGTGINTDTGAANYGAYFGLIEKGSFATATESSTIAQVFAYTPSTATKAASTLEFDLTKLDPSKEYEVASWRAHGNPSPSRYLGSVDFDLKTQLTAVQWGLLNPSQTATATAEVVSATKADGLHVKVKASELPGDIYGALFVTGTEGALEGQNSDAYTAFAIPFPVVTEGKAEFVLKAPAAKLDRSKSYQVVLWKKHGTTASENIYARADVNVTAAQWDAIFKKDTPKPVKAPFTDVKKGDKFFNEINWMYTKKLSTGVKQADGTVVYQPKGNVTREAMAAFLFRLDDNSAFKAPKKSPFADVKTTDKFYREIAWMHDQKLSTGTKQANGTRKYDPKSSITREAMAAFMYRLDTGDKAAAAAKSPFIDVKKGDKFYKEIVWMYDTKISTGNNVGGGKKAYAPKDNVTREAMAAFLYRADK